MIYDLPKYVIRDTLTTSSRLIGYADDSTVYVKAKSLKSLISELESLAINMINFCNENGLIINTQKTQILSNAKQEIKVKIGNEIVQSNKSISLLGLEYDENFSTAPYLKKLAREASTRAALIRRLSFKMPNCLLKPIANGILMGKILSAAPAAIPIKLSPSDKPFLTGILEDIDKSIRATARSIANVNLKDHMRSETVLWKAGLRSLTEAVCETMACSIWKARKEMNPLGCIFKNKTSARLTRSSSSNKLCQPVPGHPEVAANKLAQVWNLMNLDSAKTLGSARNLARQWFRETAKFI